MVHKRKRIIRPEEDESDSDIPSRTRHKKVNYEESEFESESDVDVERNRGQDLEHGGGDYDDDDDDNDRQDKLVVNLSIGQELSRKISENDNSNQASDDQQLPLEDSEEEDGGIISRPRTSRKGLAKKRAPKVEESEFEISNEDDDDLSVVSEDAPSDRGFIDDADDDIAKSTSSRRRRKKGLRRGRPPGGSKKKKSKPRLHQDDDSDYSDGGADHDDDDEDDENLSDEIRDLQGMEDESPDMTPRKHLRARKEVNYQILPPPAVEDYVTPERRPPPKGHRKLFPTVGPFGGSDGTSLFGGASLGSVFGIGSGGGGMGNNKEALVNDGSDDSDDDANNKSKTLGTPGAGFGKVKKTGLADSDPLGVDMNIDFSSVGGLDHYINQLKEMVSLPLMYPEVYQNFSVTPPRGVLFHGPPGTGKTLMARALAASCSTGGKKITFFMRKGADCLSKWVGEAERQLRLLFEEARNQQPSIIFFDEIDGLAPVRSSKQEQIHASIVSTLLALMDGMDNRGQVIVIGATNRPDSVDPALRRPGRFDREFYFPLPDLEARKKIISINTRKWNPPLRDNFIDKIARMTKGYGGADLRALSTEAALNAIQRKYPQIYQSEKKLKIDPTTIHVTAVDFMKSIDKIIPSSARSASTGAQPLPKRIEPLLETSLQKITNKLDHLFPKRKKLTPLEEAMYENFDDVDADGGFERQEAMKEFQNSRVFKPRLLVYGEPGMGQQYIISAIQHHLEGFHIQSFDMATLMSDSTRTPEAAIVQLITEVKRHTPSVVLLPNVDTWCMTMSETAKSTFRTLIGGFKPTDQILVLGMVECNQSELSPEVRYLFGYSSENSQELELPHEAALTEFFQQLFVYIRSKPSDYPDPEQRPKRKLEVLEEAPVEEAAPKTKAELKAQEKKDIQLKNTLKLKLNPTMEALRIRYKRFRKAPIDDSKLMHLYDPVVDTGDPAAIVQHYYTKTDDNMILEVATGKKFYNMDLDVIEERLWNGYYSEPRQLLKDVELMAIDARTLGDRERIIKSQEMLTNVQVWIDEVSNADLMFVEQCHEMHKRIVEAERSKAKQKELESISEVVPEGPEPEGVPSQKGDFVTTSEQQVVHSETEVRTETGVSDSLVNGNGNGSISVSVETNGDVVMQETSEHENGNGLRLGESKHVFEESESKPILPDAAAPLPSNGENPVAMVVSAAPVAAEVAPVAQEPEKESTPTPQPQQDVEKQSEPEPEPEPVREPSPEVELDNSKLEEFRSRLVKTTRGLVIEELEQVNSALVDTVWTNRQSWDRNVIIDELENTLTSITNVMHQAKKTLLEDWNH